MAGHSHWANIAHKKGAIDKKRGKVFGRLARAIIIAAKRGGDPAANLALRYAIDRAKKLSMPADTIERAIKKGTGELETEQYDEVLYEGYGPGGVAVLCEILTENRNRTAAEVRKLFENHGGNLGSTGCVAWMFERKGLLQFASDKVTEERLIELALDAGASDVVATSSGFEVTTTPDQFQAVCEAIESAGIAYESAEVTRIPGNLVTLDVEIGRDVVNLLEALDDHDDVQSVSSNADLPEALLAELANS